jgi:ribosome-associated translation inhibitor RaiA
MNSALQITFRDIPPSAAIDGHVRRRAEKLDTLGERPVACHVAIEAPHRHKRHGRHYRVRLDLEVPGRVIVVDRCPDAGAQGEDVYVAIDRAFALAMRRLRDSKRRRDEH